MERICVLFGGKSEEHEVSLLSAKAVIDAFDKNKFDITTIGITKQGEFKLFNGTTKEIADGSWEKTAVPFSINKLREITDFVFPVLHGPFGEDGTMQGLLEVLDIPYAGCNVLGSSLCMDKVMAKNIFEKVGIPTCKYLLVNIEQVERDIDKVITKIENMMDYPVFVKPSNMGSSVGITKAENRDELIAGLKEAGKFDMRLIVEEGLDCRELETGVIGNYTPIVSEVGEIVKKQDFYDYRSKYTDDAGTELAIPADISPEVREEIRTLAEKAYKALDCSGFSRVDFFIEKSTGKIYLNEINTIPGFTKYSMFPLLFKEAGVEFTDLVERIVKYGHERYNTKNHR